MFNEIIYSIKSALDYYFSGIIFISGIILSIFITPTINSNKFPVEYKFAKLGGIFYMFLGVSLLIVIWLLG